MNPNSNNETVNINLPSPSLEQVSPVQPTEQVPAVGATTPEFLTPTQNDIVQPSVAPANSPMTQGTPVIRQSTIPSPQDNAALIANDTDRIERHWVLKAKQVIANTRSDPYAQTQQIGELRAEYIKKRYNKDVKTGKS